MASIFERLKSSIIIPMHWFSDFGLARFLEDVSGTFPIDIRNEPSITVSLRDLPPRPTVVVLRPQWLRDPQ